MPILIGVLAILEIVLVGHYQSDYGIDDPRGAIDWDEAKQSQIVYGDTSLPIYSLKEGEYVVIEQ